MVTTLFINSSRAANSVVGDCILTTFKLIGALWLSLLPARMKKIHPKMKVPDWSQHFSHFKSMENFPDTQWQLTPQSKVVVVVVVVALRPKSTAMVIAGRSVHLTTLFPGQA